MDYKAISADSHVNEPPNCFVDHAPAKYKDRVPHCVELENGGQGFHIEGLEKPMPLGLTAVNYRSSKRYDRYNFRDKFQTYKDGVGKGVRFEDILAGSFDPKARIVEQDEDKVQCEIMYSTPRIWAGIKAMPDRDVQLASFRAYNNWISEFERYAPERLVGVGLIPVSGIEDATAELRRCVDELGLRTVALESYPNGSLFEESPEDDRFWAVAEEIGIPISVHASFTLPTDSHLRFARFGRESLQAASSVGNFSRILERLILTGVFDRFPCLRLVGAEVNLSWVPYYLQEFNRSFQLYGKANGLALELTPSEYFRRNVLITFILDKVGVENRYLAGIDNIMWSSDYPHTTSNFPIDVDLAEAQLEGVPSSERERIMWRTCADLYGLSYKSSDARTAAAVS